MQLQMKQQQMSLIQRMDEKFQRMKGRIVALEKELTELREGMPCEDTDSDESSVYDFEYKHPVFETWSWNHDTDVLVFPMHCELTKTAKRRMRQHLQEHDRNAIDELNKLLYTFMNP